MGARVVDADFARIFVYSSSIQPPLDMANDSPLISTALSFGTEARVLNPSSRYVQMCGCSSMQEQSHCFVCSIHRDSRGRRGQHAARIMYGVDYISIGLPSHYTVHGDVPRFPNTFLLVYQWPALLIGRVLCNFLTATTNSVRKLCRPCTSRKSRKQRSDWTKKKAESGSGVKGLPPTARNTNKLTTTFIPQ